MNTVQRLAHVTSCAAVIATALVCASLLAPFEGRRVDGDSQLFHGGVFHTGSYADGGHELTVQALLVRDGRIVDMGDFAQLSQRDDARGAARTDLGGAHVFPGFQDAHGDLEELGRSLEVVDLVDCGSFDELISRVQAAASTLPEGQWVEGYGWDQALFEGQEFPRHDALSKAVPKHPVWLGRIGGQAGLANRAAMVVAGVIRGESESADKGGPGEDTRILRDERGPTGVFLDGGMAHVAACVPAPSTEVRTRRMLRAQEHLLTLGVTCVHYVGVDREGVEILAEMMKGGQLRLRVVAYVDVPPASELAALAALARSIDGLNKGAEQLVVRGVFLQVDGGFGSRGAALLADYADAPGQRGRKLPSVSVLSSAIEGAARLGLQPAVHAVGDAAVRATLDAFAQVAARADGLDALRPRIEHMQLVDDVDLVRFRALGVTSSMQPAHVAADFPFLVERLGKGRAGRAYAWHSVRKRSGGVLAFGSAFPASSPDPRIGLHAAVTRQTTAGRPKDGFVPNQRLSARHAIEAFTQGAAAACLQEQGRGRLARGYGCDLTAFSEDVSRWAPATAAKGLDVKIVATVVNGRLVYRAK